MNKKIRDSLIAVGFGLAVTIAMAIKNHGSVSAIKTGRFWGEISYALLLAIILTAILYIFMGKNKAKSQNKKPGGPANPMVKRPKGKNKSKGKKKKK